MGSNKDHTFFADLIKSSIVPEDSLFYNKHIATHMEEQMLHSTIGQRISRMNKKKLQGLKYFLLALPFMVFVFAFSYVPLISWIYAFFDYKMGMPFLDLRGLNFAGFNNFAKLIRESGETLRVLRNTLVMSSLNILTSPLPVVFAILLNEIRATRVRKVIQTTTTLPHFISWVVVYGIAFSMFSMNGMINGLCELLNLPVSVVSILGNNDVAWFFHLGLGVWKSLGWSAIIYIAAIVGIDQELYDAARIDGANKFRTILHVTIPGIAPTYVVLLLLNISNLLNNGFDQYFVFYNSMVADKVEVLDYYVYKVGFLIGDYSYSIALGMLKTFVSITLLFSVNLISKKVRGESLV